MAKPKTAQSDTQDDGNELWTGMRMARFLGITDRQLRSLVEQHVIKPDLVPVNGRNARRYEPISVNAQYREYSIENALKRQRSRTKESGDVQDLEVRIKKLQAMFKEEQTEKLRLQNKLNRGELLPRGEVMDALRGFFIPLKRFIQSVPSRVVGMLSGTIDPLEVRRVSTQLTAECNDNLRGFVLAGERIEPHDVEGCDADDD